MSEVLTRVEVDCESGTTRIVPLTPAELAELRERQAAYEAEKVAREAEEAAKAAAKAALIESLGLSDEDLAVLQG